MNRDIKSFLTVSSFTKELARIKASVLVGESERGLSLRDSGALLRSGAALARIAGGDVSWATGMFYTARALLFLPAHRARGVALLLQVAGEHGPYAAKACLALGNFYTEEGEFELARQFYHDAVRLADRNFIVRFLARKNEAVSIAMEGRHERARKGLENLHHLATLVASHQPVYFFEYLNSLALELHATGNRDDALRLSRAAVASPFARYYPEWRQSLVEIEGEPRRAMVSLAINREQQAMRIWRIYSDESLSGNQMKACADAAEMALRNWVMCP